MHLLSVVRAPVEPLRCLLGCGSVGWVELVVGDMRHLQASTGAALAELGDPVENAGAWLKFLRNYPQAWRGLVRRMCYHDNPTYSQALKAKVGGIKGTLANKECPQCSEHFATARALAMHQRKVHGARSELRHFAPRDGRCPVCLAKFSSRLRLIGHLCEKRVRGGRVPCGAVLTPCMRISDPEIEAGDLEDRTARREAARAGKTQPRSRGEVIPPPKRRRVSKKIGPEDLQWRLVRGLSLLQAAKRQRVSAGDDCG